jgi:hypothetical protein
MNHYILNADFSETKNEKVASFYEKSNDFYRTFSKISEGYLYEYY